MPKVIDQAVKTQIIELYKQGRGRNDIAEAEGVKGFASSGTVSAVIMQYKQQISSESVKELPDTTIAGLEESIENGVPGSEKEIQTPQTQPRSEQLSVEIEGRQKKEQIENDIVILDAELRYIEDRIDEGYRIIDAYKKIAADFSVVKQEMADAGMTFTDSILFKSIVGIFKKHNYSSAKIMRKFAELSRMDEQKEEIAQQQQEIDKQKKVLERRLEETNNERAFRTIINTLGIGPEEVKRILIREMSSEQMELDESRRQYWGHRANQGWDLNDNNGENYNQEYDNQGGYG
jgi:hypothetical protein